MYLFYGKLPWDLPNITNTGIRDMKQSILYGAGAETIPKIFAQVASIIFACREKSSEPNYKSLLDLFKMYVNAK
jgi:hypothetical protein